MIYIGFVNFKDTNLAQDEKLKAAISCTHSSVKLIKKDKLTICYGKLSDTQDVDKFLENHDSILIGRACTKASKEEINNLSDAYKEKILDNVWGKYIYICYDKNLSLLKFIVDPTGQLPFFFYRYDNGNILFSSDIEVIFKALMQIPEYDWAYINSFLLYGNSNSIRTPFKNIYEIPPGCHLILTEDNVDIKPHWNPLLHTEELSVHNHNTVNVLQDTLQFLTEPYTNICVSLSGGLDSSALVYCVRNIKRPDQILTALNYFNSSIQSSNELEHARRVCEENSIDLIEFDTCNCYPFDPFATKSPINPNKPFVGLLSLKTIDQVSQLITKDSSIFLSGHGSDHIFMRPPTRNGLSDYILENGFKGASQHLKNITDFYRDSIFSVLQENMLSLIFYFHGSRKYKRHHRKNIAPDWIKPEIYNNILDDFIHPIYNHLPSKILPGKYTQINNLYDGLASIHMEMNKMYPTCYPYLYQPLVEYALAFPTYRLLNGGYDRYPLRKDLSTYFDTKTVWRRDKSQATGIFQLGVKRNLEYILDLCIEGRFVRQGLVDKTNLYKSIMHISNGSVDNLWPFMQLTSCEIFFKFWDDKSIPIYRY